MRYFYILFISGSLLIYFIIIPLIKFYPLLIQSSDDIPLLYLWDDTFYYFIIARNIVEGLGPTFDGVGLTNGFHPLQTLLWMPIVAVPQSPDTIVLFAHAQNLAMWSLALVLVVAIGRRLGLLPHMVLALPFFVRYAAHTQTDMFFRGFETPYVITAILAFVYHAISVDLFRIHDVRTRSTLAGGLLLAVVFLSRLDTVLWIGFLSLILLYRFTRASATAASARSIQGLRFFALLFGPTVLLAVFHVLANVVVFDAAVPVSTLAKSVGGPYFNLDMLKYFMWLGGSRTVPFFSAPIVVIAGLVAVRFLMTPDPGGIGHDAAQSCGVDNPNVRATLAILLVAFLGGLFLEVAYLYLMYNWEGESQYFFLLPVIALLAVPILTRGLLRRLQVPTLATAAIGLIAAVAGTAMVTLQVRSLPSEAERRESTYLGHSRYAAQWLRTNTPQDSLYAMGDRAGSLALYLERPVYQLQGLANSVDFLRARAARRVNNEYLLKRGIDYVVASAYWRRKPFRDAGPGCIWLMEPYWGVTAPKVELRLCDADRVYHKVLGDGCYSVWKLNYTYPQNAMSRLAEHGDVYQNKTRNGEPCAPSARARQNR